MVTHGSSATRRHRVLTLAVAAVMALAVACAPASSSPPPSDSVTTTTLPPPTGPLSCDTDFSTAPAEPLVEPATDGEPEPVPLDDATLQRDVAAASAASPFGVVEVTTVDPTGRPEFRLVAPDDVAAIVRNRAVTSVEAPVRVTTQSSPGDPLRPQLWGLDDVKVDAVHHCSTGAGITVAVIDSGVQADHPDLAGRVVAGPSILDLGTETPGGGGVDPDGHGTHVAGTVAAITGNGIGVASVAPDATIHAIRVLDAQGSGWSTDVATGITRAVDAGVDVINLSLGSETRSGSIRTAVDHAWNNGVVVIAAAGNTPNCSNPCWPGAEPNAIAVAAHNSSRSTASFSVNGSWLDVSAPGVGIISTYPLALLTGSGYASLNGTSMASPHVAGVAALMLATDPTLTPAQVRGALQRGAIDIGTPGFDHQSGHGAIDAAYTWQLHAPN